MAKSVVIDEFHLLIFIPKTLSYKGARAVRRALRRRGFVAKLRGSVAAFINRYPCLRGLRITLGR